MSLLIPRGRSWLRLQLVSPANFGSSGGRATLDRPVALSSWTSLPLIPFSSLGGVLAGRFGDVYADRPSKRLNQRRTAIFGSPDNPDTGVAGSAGKLVFGDGEMLSFPAPLADGRTAHVVSMTTVAWLARTGFAICNMPPVVNRSLAYTRLGGLPGGVETDGNPGVVPALLDSLAPLIGVRSQDLVLAAPDAARALWRSAAEVRTMTALSAPTKRVRAGTLRRVELVPAGTVFIALLTNQSGEVDLGPERLQLGAWEAWGCGHVRASVLVTPPAAPAPAKVDPTIPDGSRLRRDDELMVDAFKAVEGAPADRSGLRSLMRETAGRLRMQGLPSTLAFSLAKAKAPKESQERAAHRWLLATLFQEPDVYAATIEAIKGTRATPQIEELCHWLSRYLSPALEDAPVRERE